MRRRAHAVTVALGALLAFMFGLLGASPALAVTPLYTYGAVAYTYDAPALPSPPDTVATGVRGSAEWPEATSWASHASARDDVVAANTVADVARPLSQVEARTMTDALRPDKLSHVFDPKHNFGPLVETYGSEAGAMEQIVRSLDGAGLPSSGIFEVTTQVGGQSVVVRGAVVDGVARIGTAFTP